MCTKVDDTLQVSLPHAPHSIPLNCIFLCTSWFVDTFNMRENYFAVSLSVILTLINFADLVLFDVCVHHKKSC